MFKVLDDDPKDMSFDDALKLLRGGRVLCRASWKKGKWLEMREWDEAPNKPRPYITVCHYYKYRRPYEFRQDCQIWQPLQEDILSEDWEAHFYQPHKSKSLGEFAFEVYSKHMGMGNSTQWHEVNDHTKAVFSALADEMTGYIIKAREDEIPEYIIKAREIAGTTNTHTHGEETHTHGEETHKFVSS